MLQKGLVNIPGLPSLHEPNNFLGLIQCLPFVVCNQAMQVLVDLLRWLLGPASSSSSDVASLSQGRSSLNVPQYQPGENADSLDLQVKALTYVFHRLQLAKMAPFVTCDRDSGEVMLEFHPSAAAAAAPRSVLITPKLDKVYNITGFCREITGDPHRVLVDWCKNKARSLFILSGLPPTVPLVDLGPDFAFHILPPDASDEEYINVLVYQSEIYAEHKVDERVRLQCVQNALKRQRQSNQYSDLEPCVFSLDDRSEIIEGYLNRLAIHVQVTRLFNSKLRDQRIHHSKSSLSSGMIGSYNLMKNHDNSANSNISSGDYSDATTVSSMSFDPIFSSEQKRVWWEQAMMSVRIRIEKERYF